MRLRGALSSFSLGEDRVGGQEGGRGERREGGNSEGRRQSDISRRRRRLEVMMFTFRLGNLSLCLINQSLLNN